MLKDAHIFQERIAKYKREERNTINDQFIHEYFLSKPKFNRSIQSVAIFGRFLKMSLGQAKLGKYQA